MKKIFTLLFASIFSCGLLNGQTVLHDNGPLVNNPGSGFGGADVSSLHSGITLLGFGHAVSSGFKVAEDFTVPAGGWTVDSIIFFAYQTGSTTASTITAVHMGIWDGSPALGANIIYGDTALDAMTSTYWSGIYRTSSTALTDATRPIMRNVVGTPGLVLAPGTYYVSWQVNGTLASGPWAPPITITGITPTGDGLQYNPTTQVWNPAKDTSETPPGAGTGEIQGFPFIVYGQGAVGIDDNAINPLSFSLSNLHPVPVSDVLGYSLQSPENGDVVLTIRDFLGREAYSEVRTVKAGANKITMDLSKLSSGAYFLTAKNDKSVVVSKFIRQ